MRFIKLLACVVVAASSLSMPSLPAVAGADTLLPEKKEPIPIDFNDVVEDSKRAGPGADLSVIRIAVAAMISPKHTYKYYIELLNRIGDEIGRKVVFIQKKTYAEVNLMLKQKELDLAFVCSGPYVSGKRDFGMEIIAVPVCHGKTVYHSYFIVSRASGIDSFDALRGRTFAFTDPLSNSGYLVPTYYLAKRGETAELFFKTIFFTYSHDNSIQAVADGVADGAAVDSLIFEFMKTRNPDFARKIRVVETSPPYGIPPVVVHPSMDPAMKEQLRNIFFSFHQSPEGRAILQNLHIDRFVRGRDDAYDSLREMLNYFEPN